jgi:SAM-dependent methyltransferase
MDGPLERPCRNQNSTGRQVSLIRSFVSANRRLSRAIERRFPRLTDPRRYLDILLGRIRADIKAEPFKILDIGGIDRPLLEKSPVYQYDGLDIDEKEDCYTIYDNFIVQSVEEPIDESYDMVISITLLEHVRNNRASVRSMFEALRPGGVTHHYIPSGFHPYSICLRLVGPKLQRMLIPIVRPDSVGVTGYPAFFDHCGTRQMGRLFRDAGFENIDVIPFYNANDYFAFFTPALIIVVLFEYVCMKFGLEFFASGFVISAGKPDSA